MQQKYRGCESCASHTSTALGQSQSLSAVWHSQPVTPKRCLYPQSETKPNAPPCQGFFFLWGWRFLSWGVLVWGVGVPEGPSPEAGMAQPLCEDVPRWPGHAALCPTSGHWDWRVQALLSLPGQVSSLLLVAGLFLCFVLLNWRKKNHQF